MEQIVFKLSAKINFKINSLFESTGTFLQLCQNIIGSILKAIMDTDESVTVANEELTHIQIAQVIIINKLNCQ